MNNLLQKSLTLASSHLIKCGGFTDYVTIEAKRIIDGCDVWHPINCDCGDWRKAIDLPATVNIGAERTQQATGYSVRTVSAEVSIPFAIDLTTSYRVIHNDCAWTISEIETGATTTTVKVSRRFS